MWKRICFLLPLLLLTSCVPQNFQQIPLNYSDVAQREAPLFLMPREIKEKAPLIVLLHAYNVDPWIQDAHLGITSMVAKNNFAFLRPAALKNAEGKRAWNVITPCCGKKAEGIDDIDYISQLIHEVTENYAVDPERVYIIGYSLGGFMAQRMACEKAELLKGILSIAGTAYQDFSQCRPARAVRIRHIHGDKDKVIPIQGGKFENFPEHISVDALMNLWVNWNACSNPPKTFVSEDKTIPHLPGQEIVHRRWSSCRDNSSVEFLLTKGDGHYIFFDPGFIEDQLRQLMQ